MECWVENQYSNTAPLQFSSLSYEIHFQLVKRVGGNQASASEAGGAAHHGGA